MTWEIVLGIIALIGVFGTVAGWSGKLSKTLASLEITLKALNDTLEELKENNRASHKDIYNKIAKLENQIVKLEMFHGGKL